VISATLVSACGGAAAPSSWPDLVVSGDTAYIAAVDRVYAVDINPDTNNLRRQMWTFPAVGQSAAATFHGRPYLSESDMLFIASDSPSGRDNFVAALDTNQLVDAGEPPNLVKTVSIKWSYPTGENAPSLGNIFGGVAGDGESVYIATAVGQVVSLAAEPEGQFGVQNWIFTATQRIWSRPVVSGSVVYATSQDKKLYALDAATGRPVWDEPFTAGATLAGTPTVHGDTVYVGSFDQKLYAVDAADGTARWPQPFQTTGWLWDGPAVYEDILYFGDLNGNLYAVQLDGTPAWDQPIQLEGMIRAQPLVTEDRIYVATGARKLYALDRISLNTDWEFTALQDGEQFLTTPVLVGNALLIPPLPSGGTPVRLYAVNATSGNLLWQFPVPEQ
jgi:outer membrane protein assembly factor BamB